MSERTSPNTVTSVRTRAVPTLRRFRGLLRPVVTDFAFRDLVPDDREQEALDAIEVLAAFDGELPPRGVPIRDLQNPQTGEHLLTVYEGEHGLHWHFANLGVFWVDPSGWHARYLLDPGASITDAESMLLGPVLGIAAQQRGETVLHASSVVVDGGAIAFSAPPGFGKSTLATSFISEGMPLLSDDMLPVTQDSDGALIAHPYVPRAKLHDDSLEEIRGTDTNVEERAVSWWGKRRLTIGDGWGDVHRGPAPLRALYFLAPSGNPSQEIEIRPLDPLEATVMLQSALYSPPTLKGQRARYALEAGAMLASTLHIARVSYHREYASLTELRARLRADALDHAR